MKVVFRTGKQHKFFEKVKKRSHLSMKMLCRLHKDKLRVGYSAMKKYRREESFPALYLVKELCQIAGLSYEKLEIEALIPDNWGRAKGGVRGIGIMSTKYGEQLKEWRSLGGKAARKSPPQTSKKVVLPPMNEKLSELIGIHLGDGTLTNYFPQDISRSTL